MPFRRGQLLYFITVAEEGQMTRAAERLHLAQPALSQAIAQLEAELDIKLLERHARGVTLTPDGEALLPKARLAVEATTEAALLAQSLARAARGTIAFGFLGAPPAVDSPRAVEAFTTVYPDIGLRYQELRFPSSPTSAWLADVDVAVCHRPPTDSCVWTQTLRVEPRAVLAPTRHPLATRNEVSVADVLDETFIGFHNSVDPAWAGFWSLDDHRGGPPPHATDDRVANPQEVLAALAMRVAITTVPSSIAELLVGPRTGMAAIPLRDAAPAEITLVGRKDRRNPLVETLAAFAQNAAEDIAAPGSGAGPRIAGSPADR